VKPNSSITLLFVSMFFFSCSDKTLEAQTLKNEVKNRKDGVVDTLSGEPEIFESNVKFSDYKTKVYTGKLADPDFTNNEFADDKEYVALFTKKCKENGINFGSCYTVFTISCGAECASHFIVNRKTGFIYTSVNPDGGKHGYAYRRGSNLLIANAELFVDKEFQHYYKYYHKPEFYVWKNDNFHLIK
jgi:hypothetical protein